jgi:hypothetical protein
MRQVILAVLIVLMCFPTRAAEFDGITLRRFCSDRIPDSPKNVLCSSYIRGLADGMLFGYLTHKSDGDVYCPPAGGLSREQAQLIVEKFMNEHPELLHEKAAVVAVAALRSAFPCKPSN